MQHCQLYPRRHILLQKKSCGSLSVRTTSIIPKPDCEFCFYSESALKGKLSGRVLTRGCTKRSCLSFLWEEVRELLHAFLGGPGWCFRVGEYEFVRMRTWRTLGHCSLGRDSTATLERSSLYNNFFEVRLRLIIITLKSDSFLNCHDAILYPEYFYVCHQA